MKRADKTIIQDRAYRIILVFQKSCRFSYPTYIFQGSNTLLIMILRPSWCGIQPTASVKGFPFLNIFICFNRVNDSTPNETIVNNT